MLRGDVLPIFILVDSSVMRVRILLTGMFGFTGTKKVNDTCALPEAKGGKVDSRHNSCRRACRNFRFLHGFGELLLHVYCEVVAVPSVGLRSILKSDLPASV